MTTPTPSAPPTSDVRLHASHAQAAALAAGRSLPAQEAIVAAEPRILTTPTDAFPRPDPRGAAVTITGGATGSLSLVVSSDLAAAVPSVASGAEELLSVLESALADALGALEVHYPDPLHPSEVRDLDVEAEADRFGEGAVAVDLLDDGEHVATLVVDLVPATTLESHVERFEPAPFSAPVEDDQPAEPRRSLELLHDVEMAVTVELGRTRMPVRDLLALAPGSVVELDRSAGSPVDVLVNGKLIARGEVVVIDEEFGIRISEIVGLRTVRP